MTSESTLVVVAGPSASGKTTFIGQIKQRQRSLLVDETFESLCIPLGIKFATVGANQARDSIRRGDGLLTSRPYRILHLDLTSKSRGKHLKFCPIIFSHFNSVCSIQIYLPYREWLNRIRARIDAGEFISRHAKKLYEDAKDDYKLGERLYRRLYVRWENFLDVKRICNRITIDPYEKIVFKRKPRDIRRNIFTRSVYAAICRRPMLSDFRR